MNELLYRLHVFIFPTRYKLEEALRIIQMQKTDIAHYKRHIESLISANVSMQSGESITGIFDNCGDRFAPEESCAGEGEGEIF